MQLSRQYGMWRGPLVVGSCSSVVTKNSRFALIGSARMPNLLSCPFSSREIKTLNVWLIRPSCNQVGEN
jgi:hypothetical protein